MRPNAQRGAALLVAMLILTLVATLAAAMVWRQNRAVQIEAAERARAQSEWILQGALDWARLILREDARANQQGAAVEQLCEVWAVPLAEARLSTFLAADKQNASDGPDAFLSGSLEDAQARYNLRNLLGGEKVPVAELRTLQRLCEGAGLPSDTATRIASGLRLALGQSDDASRAIAPQTLSQLSWLGLPAATLLRLRPLVTLLPTATPVNLNTAPREVIAALFDGVDLGSAERLVQARANKPLQNLQEAAVLLPQGLTLAAERAAVNTQYFEVGGRLRLDDRVMELRSLVRRNGLEMQVLSRTRVNVLTPTP